MQATFYDSLTAAFRLLAEQVDILYVSHCVPWPPDKGERIRAFHSLRLLLTRHRVHLACLARSEAEAHLPSDLKARCASARIELLDPRRGILRGLRSAALGGCFTTAFYASPELQRHVAAILREKPIGAVVLLSSGMASFAPTTVPFFADWGDVDSEKRFQYAKTRWNGFAQRLEAERLRRVEREVASRARHTFLVTENELGLFRRIAPGVPASVSGDGVDFGWFDPWAPLRVMDDLRRRKFLVFVGVLSYFPNSDGICHFADMVFPKLRRHDPELELFVVGRDPTRAVLRLADRPGITVTGTVPDVRPYLAAARAAVVPLRIARGIQNKVLEALAMGKSVLASDEVCETFAPDVPFGVIRCGAAEDYQSAAAAFLRGAEPDTSIVAATRARFTWSGCLAPMLDALDEIERGVSPASVPRPSPEPHAPNEPPLPASH